MIISYDKLSLMLILLYDDFNFWEKLARSYF